MELLLKDNTTSQKPTFIISAKDQYVSVADEFITAQYSLTSRELKTWVILISSIQSSTQISSALFEFDAISFADRLGIDSRKARGTEVANLLSRLSNVYIDIRSRTDHNGEQDILHTVLVSTVLYSRRSHIVRVRIPDEMLPFIFALKAGTFLEAYAETIVALNTTAAMRIFLLLRNLERISIDHISISEFRDTIGVSPKSTYKDYKRTVIKKSVDEIHKHTEFKDFYIIDDCANGHGGRGDKATTLFFGFEKKELAFEMSNVSTLMCKTLQSKFSPRVLIMIEQAVEFGFNPRFIKNKFDNFDDDRIIANISIVIDRIRKDKQIGQEKSPDEYGRYFIPAVVNDWAGQGKVKEKALKQASKRIANRKLNERMKDIQVVDEVQNLAADCYERSKDYVASLDISELLSFIKKNKASLDKLAGSKGFNMDKALSRKKTYREFRILCQYISGKTISGEMQLPRQSSLFT